MRILVFIFLLGTALPVARAQAQAASDAVLSRHATALDFTGALVRSQSYATSQSRSYLSAAGWRLWGIDPNGRFQFGIGARISYYRSQQGVYDLTERAPVYSPRASSQVIYPNIFVMNPRLVTLNAALHLRARVVGPVRVGFTIDLAGLTGGTGKLLSPNVPGTTLRPTQGNLLRGGAKDRGSLNSEFYVSADLTPHLSTRAGLSHVVNGYELTSPNHPTYRYHRFGNLGMLGVTYTF